MFVINILAFVLSILVISQKSNKKPVEILPVVTGGTVLVLYILSLFRALFLIDVFGSAIILVFIIIFAKMPRENKTQYIKECMASLKNTSSIIFLILFVLIMLGVRDKLVTWWDDYNFWATDAKAIFATGGLPSKYCNVQPEFGDYPPAMSLIKWWFLHMKPSAFDEGLMFGGYYFFIFAFLAPLLKYTDDKNIFARILSGVILVLLLPCIEAFHLDGCSADVCMALCYGSYLVALTDRNSSVNRLFYYGRLAVYLSVMMLCKDSSMMCLAFALIYTIAYRLVLTDGKVQSLKMKIKEYAYIFVPALLFWGSWYGYCFINRRIAKVVSNGAKMIVGKMAVPAYRSEIFDAFIEAFFKWPLHRYYQAGFNLTPCVFLLLTVVSLILLGVFRVLSKKETIFYASFAFVSGIIINAVVLVCHLTIFATEDQYLDPFAVVSSIERYTAPFTIGMLLLMLNLMLRKNNYVTLAIIASFVLLTTDYVSVYRGYVGYRSSLDLVKSERENILNEDIVKLSSDCNNEQRQDIGRILYIRDREDLSWISHAYISFEMAPLSMMYGYTDNHLTVGKDDEFIINMANDSHSKYVYLYQKIYGVDEETMKLFPVRLSE